MSNSTADEQSSAATNGGANDGYQDNPAQITDNDQNPEEKEAKMTGSSTEIMAKGISSMLSSVIRDFDSKAVSVTHSQDHLSSSLDRLTAELDQLLEDAPLPFIMQHAAKLSNVRKRVSSLNSVLKSIQRRLDNIDRTMSVCVPNDRPNVGGTA